MLFKIIKVFKARSKMDNRMEDWFDRRYGEDVKRGNSPKLSDILEVVKYNYVDFPGYRIYNLQGRIYNSK